jgi:integrase
LHDVESRIHALLRGLKEIPPNVDPGDYIVWGEAAALSTPATKAVPSLRELTETYLEAHKEFKATSTIEGERIHLQNIGKCLAAATDRPLDRLGHRDLEVALRKRLGDVSGATVNKERRTLLSFFKWVVRQGYLTTSPATGLPLAKIEEDRPPFRTLEEIEGIIKRGEIDEAEVEGIWECLYLNPQEIGEILGLVNMRAKEDFIHPMFAIVAYTGMRRGEMLRFRWLDVDLQRKVVTARSRKQSRQRKVTAREIDMHPELEAVLQEYRQSRPTGQQVISWAKNLIPLTIHQANNAFHQPLKGTRWEREMPPGKKKIVIGFHSFRHSFASNLAVAGVDQRIIDRWMGHVTEAMRRRYQHLFPKTLSASIRKLSFSGNGHQQPSTQAGISTE